MIWAGHHRRTPIGIDIGRRYVKAAQLSRSRSGWRVEAAASYPRPVPQKDFDAEDARLLRGVLDRRGSTGERFVLAVPKEALLTGILELPPRSAGAPLDQLARMELARMHRCRPDALEVTYWDLPAPNRGNAPARVMASGCTHQSAEGLMDCLENEGLDVQALDVQACALARACRPLFAGEKDITCLLDIGWQSSWLALIHMGTVVYQRPFGETGIQPLFEALNGQLELDGELIDALLCEVGVGRNGNEVQDDSEAFDDLRGMVESHLESILKELRLSFSYAIHQYPGASVAQLVLVGGGALLQGIQGHLSSALEVQVQTVAPTDVAECPPPLLETCGSPAMTMAVGLAQFAHD